jgi:arabinoxylan arabinofuranohydrolase
MFKNRWKKDQIKEPLAKKPRLGNPVVSHKFGADPYALEYNGRIYVYMTYDEPVYDKDGNMTENTYSNITSLSVISSSDMVNWTDHGQIELAGENGAAKWAKNAWAPAVAHKVIENVDKFFIYFANNGTNIGVVTSDSPLGPWTDPISGPIISRELGGVDGIPWLFDPAVLVDDSGEAYLYFGGGVPDDAFKMPLTSRVVQLHADMVRVQGTIKAIPAPFMFEDSGINKIHDTYYYSYCSNFYEGEREENAPQPGEISYMTSSHPMGPFTYQKTILKNPGHFFNTPGNNHHAMFTFKDNLYIAYHAQTLGKAMGISHGYRSTHIDQVAIDSQGVIQDIQATREGVESLVPFNPYQPISGATYAWQAGVEMRLELESQGKCMAVLTNGAWLGLRDVEFKGIDHTCVMTYSGTIDRGEVNITINSIDGDNIGHVSLPKSHEQEGKLSVQIPLSIEAAVVDVYISFTDELDHETFYLHEWEIKKANE